VLRVVADTNVYVSALVFGGKPMEFLERARARQFDLAMSEDIIAEVAHVLRDHFGWEKGRVGDAYDIITGCTRPVEPTERLTVITEDPDDDRILECAVTARAERIVSRDLDLRRLGAFRGIPILTLAEFMRQLDGA
jgi:putative PIN family toxin of toxin-antitoxin system